MSDVLESFVKTTTIDVDTLRSAVSRDDTNLYAVLDACDEPLVPVFAGNLRERAASLYRGNAEQDHAKIAPYIAAVDSITFDWIRDNLFGKPWGFFATSKLDLLSVRTHFRKFLLVDGPESKELYFRFYDPRVLQPFLESADPQKLNRFFGPVDEMQIVNAELEVIAFQRSPEVSKSGAASLSRKIAFTQTDMADFAEARRAIFAKRLLTQISGKLRELGRNYDSQMLAEQIDKGIQRALEYEMNAQCYVARYVETACIKLHGFEGDRDPIPIQDILFDRRIGWNARLDNLDQFAMANLDAAAEKS